MPSHVPQPSTWWDEARIRATVTRQFVCSHLLPEARERLCLPVAFGGSLTDGTYWDWIEQRAKRIFLILLDLGVPDVIFGVVDASWDDSDLPIALDQIKRLELPGPASDERKFYYRQYHYLLKPLHQGAHVVYQECEVVPLDLLDRRAALNPGGGASGGGHAVDKVTLPGLPGQVLCRRRIPIGSGPGYLAHEDFQDEISRVRNLSNQHLVSYFASYMHQGFGYVLFTPASDASLRTMLTATPAFFKALEKETRRRLVVNWIHCLVDTLCFIHSRGLSHGNIRPSAVLFNSDNHVFFSDLTRLDDELLAAAGAPEHPRATFDKEAYDYAAPEQWFRPSSSLGPVGTVARRGTSSSLAGASTEGVGAEGTFSISRGASDGHQGMPNPTAMTCAQNPHLNPQAADIFSLGCVILELLGLLMKRPTRVFASHRAARHKLAGRGGAVLDSSFHRNLGQVESWMTALGKDARKKDGAVFRGVTPMLHVVERMLALQPSERPSVHDVQTRMYQILTESCGISEPHCVHAPYPHYAIESGLKILPTRAASSPGAVETAEDDTISIATARRKSGPGARLPRRTSSSGGAPSSYSSSPSWSEPPEQRQRYSPTPGPGGGLQAMRNLQIRDSASPRSPWQTPSALAGKS